MSKMFKLSSGVEVSEDTVISALSKAGIAVKPEPKKVRVYKQATGLNGVFLKVVDSIASGVDISIVDNEGRHKKHLCQITPEGLYRYYGIKDYGIEADKSGRMKLEND